MFCTGCVFRAHPQVLIGWERDREMGRYRRFKVRCHKTVLTLVFYFKAWLTWRTSKVMQCFYTTCSKLGSALMNRGTKDTAICISHWSMKTQQRHFTGPLKPTRRFAICLSSLFNLHLQSYWHGYCCSHYRPHRHTRSITLFLFFSFFFLFPPPHFQIWIRLVFLQNRYCS